MSITLLTFLNEKGIPFIINTTAENPCQAASTMAARTYRSKDKRERTRMEVPSSTALLALSVLPYEKKMHHPTEYSYRGTILRTCGHVLSAQYEKHVPIQYMIETYDLPTLAIIHVDDGFVNIRTVLDEGFEQHVFGLYYPTVIGTTVGAEPAHEDSLKHVSEHSTKITSNKKDTIPEYEKYIRNSRDRRAEKRRERTRKLPSKQLIRPSPQERLGSVYTDSVPFYTATVGFY